MIVRELKGSGLDEISTEERVVCKYHGANLIDAGHVVRVRFTSPRIPCGLRTKLRDQAGFKSGPNASLQRVSTTQAIFQAQAILNEFLERHE